MNQYNINNIDFTNRNEVLEQYYPFCQELLQQILLQQYGDNVQVWAFDHNVRRQSLSSSSSSTTTTSTKEGEAVTDIINTINPTTVIQKPIGLVHGDYTTISAPRRLELLSQPPKINDVHYEQFQKELLMSSSSSSSDSNHPPPRTSLLDPKLVQECLRSNDDPSTTVVDNDKKNHTVTSPRRGGGDGSGTRRYALINVWKNIDTHHPVMALPLACVDATTVSMEQDVRTLELHYTDRIGENYLACRPPPSSPQRRREHQWVYYPHMTHEEVLLIKQWDSAGTEINHEQHITTGDTNPKNDDDDIDDNNEYIATMALHSAFIDPTTPLNNTIPRQSIEVRCVAIWV
jgi:hypothetical protein